MSAIKEFQHLKISLKTLESATDNFAETNCIGRGGFGKVYKGEILLSGVLTMVAIKRLDRSLGQETIEFWKEIMMLSQYKHENLVSLLGFCDEGHENLLVYEYLSKKSLDLYLSSNDLSWLQRLSICLRAGKGLRYLHEPVEGSQQRVLHRDIKSANILLDHNWRPKIADFGLSKVGPANQQFTYLFSNAVGTMGYCDPLYAHTGFLTKESDVYSFGVVLFEVLCGRHAYVQNNNDIHKSLAALARKCYEEKKLDTIIHSGIRKTISPKSLERFSAIAYQCLHINREERPSMAKVVLEILLAHRYQAVANVVLLPEVPMKEIKVATGNFRMCIRENAQYQIYKGELSISKGKPTMVFIKRFCERSDRDINLFLNELLSLSGQQPPNILSLLGYCDEERKKIIIYEYAERGSLDQYISSRRSNTTDLTWFQRLQICVGAAHGLNQLHNRSLIHNTFRSANILLDNKWVAKVCDFMISSTSTGLDVLVDNVYGAPEYILSGKGSKEADVYSLGVLLFEVLCGRLFTEEVDGDNMLSAKLMRDLYVKKKLGEIVDPALLRAQLIGNVKSLEKYSAIAYRCLSDHPNERPTMEAVIKELEELLKIEVELNDSFELEHSQLEMRAKAAEELENIAVDREKKMEAKMELIEEELARQKKIREELEERMKEFNEMMLQQRNLPPPS